MRNTQLWQGEMVWLHRDHCQGRLCPGELLPIPCSSLADIGFWGLITLSGNSYWTKPCSLAYTGFPSAQERKQVTLCSHSELSLLKQMRIFQQDDENLYLPKACSDRAAFRHCFSHSHSTTKRVKNHNKLNVLSHKGKFKGCCLQPSDSFKPV